MNGEDVVNVAGAIVYWLQNRIITTVDFINAHGWTITAAAVAGVGVALNLALYVARRRRKAVRVASQRTPTEDREVKR